MILQLRHTTFITQSVKEIHSGRETGLIDTGPLLAMSHKNDARLIWAETYLFKGHNHILLKNNNNKVCIFQKVSTESPL